MAIVTNWADLAESQQKHIKSWQAISLILAVVGELFLAGDWYGFAAVIPFVSKEMTLSAGQAGLIQGVFAITYGLGMFVWSPIGRTMSARSLSTIGLLGTGIFMFLQSYADSYAMLLLSRLVIGFFDAAVWIGTMKLIVGWFPPQRRGAMMGIVLAAFSLAITMDFAIGIPLTIQFGWRAFFAGLGVLTVLAAALSYGLMRAGPVALGIPGFAWAGDVLHHMPVKLGEIFKVRWLWIGILGIFGDTFAIAATATWVIPAFITVQGMPVGVAPIIGTIMGLSQVVFLLIGGWGADRARYRTSVLKLGALLSIFSALTFLLATMYAMPLLMLIGISALSGVAVFSGGAIFSLVAEKYGDALAASAIGYAEVGGILSTFVAPALMGAVIDITHSFAAAFLLFTLVEVVILGLLMVFGRESAETTLAASVVA